MKIKDRIACGQNITIFNLIVLLGMFSWKKMMDQSPTFSTSADLAYYADKYDSMGFHVAEKVIDKVNNKYGFQIKFWSSFNVEIFCFFIYVLYFRQMK